MEHKHKIQKLADFLADMDLEDEACNLLSLIKSSQKKPSIEDWYLVLQEVDAPYVDPVYNTLSNYLKEATSNMNKAVTGLKDATPEDLKNIANVIPISKLVSSATYNRRILTKKGSDPYRQAAEFCHKQGWIEKPNYKKANWWKYIKTLGGKTVKYVIPFASLIFGIVNFYYCAVEFSKLISELPAADLSWHEALMPKRIYEVAEKNLENPETLRAIVKAAKTSKTFVDEFISMTGSLIDAYKDLIFLIVDIISGGSSIALDLGISFVILLVEFAIKGAVLPMYQKTIKLIRDTAVDSIKLFELKSFKEIWKDKKEEIDEEYMLTQLKSLEQS